jgi:hypothetical protein
MLPASKTENIFEIRRRIYSLLYGGARGRSYKRYLFSDLEVFSLINNKLTLNNFKIKWVKNHFCNDN